MADLSPAGSELALLNISRDLNLIGIGLLLTGLNFGLYDFPIFQEAPDLLQLATHGVGLCGQQTCGRGADNLKHNT
jgi:hypothetical protein